MLRHKLLLVTCLWDTTLTPRPGLLPLHSKFFLLGFEHGLVLQATLTRGGEGITGTRPWTSHLSQKQVPGLSSIFELVVTRSDYKRWYNDENFDYKCIWNKSYMRTAEMKSNEGWSSQLGTQFMQLCKKPEKNSGLQQNLNPWPRKVLGSNAAEVLNFFQASYAILLHKLRLQLQGSILIWRILKLITSWILTSLAIICLQECGCSIFIACGMITLHSERWLS